MKIQNSIYLRLLKRVLPRSNVVSPVVDKRTHVRDHSHAHDCSSLFFTFVHCLCATYYVHIPVVI